MNPTPTPIEGNAVFWIEVEKIHPNPYQPRREFNEAALRDLAESIRMYGVLQPLVVTRVEKAKEDGGIAVEYELISGERRLRASKMAGLTEVPAYVRTANDQEVVEMALIENIQREDLNSMEVALTYQRLIDECDLTHENLGDRLGKDRSTVTNYLRLLKLPPEIQKALRDKVLSMGHARAIISVPEVDKQLYVLKEINTKGLSVRKTEELVRLLSSNSSAKKQDKKEVSLPASYKNVQAKLMDIFETKIKIKKTATDKGEIIIPFYSVSDLNRLLDIIEKD